MKNKIIELVLFVINMSLSPIPIAIELPKSMTPSKTKYSLRNIIPNRLIEPTASFVLT